MQNKLNAKQANQLLLPGINASLRGSAVVMQVYNEGSWDIEEKADRSPLTRADREAHDAIHRILAEAGLETPILSEEGAHLPFGSRKHWKRFWMVDPLDGTKEFLSRHGEFTVNVALVDGETPVLGIVSVPARDTFYIAVSSHGSYRATGEITNLAAQSSEPLAVLSAEAVRLGGNGEEISSRSAKTVRVIASRSHLNAETQAFIDSLKTGYESVELVQAGSAVKLCRVAEGVADYYPRLAPTMEWDTAAGDIVVREAGGKVLVADGDGRADGAALTYNKEDLHNPYFIAAARGFDL